MLPWPRSALGRTLRAVAAVALFTLSASSDTFLLLKAREVGISARCRATLLCKFRAVGSRATDRLDRSRCLGLGSGLAFDCDLNLNSPVNDNGGVNVHVAVNDHVCVDEHNHVV